MFLKKLDKSSKILLRALGSKAMKIPIGIVNPKDLHKSLKTGWKEISWTASHPMGRSTYARLALRFSFRISGATGEYSVSLQSRQLGMTVENVLEPTIVRSVYPNSEAFRLNVRPNSVILSIGASRFPNTILSLFDSFYS